MLAGGIRGLCGVDGRDIVDVAADDLNHLHTTYLTAEDHGGDGALSAAAEWGPVAWCNPPYRRIMPWVLRGQLAAEHGTRSMWLVPSALDTAWGRELAASAVWWLTAGRVRFIDPNTGTEGGSPPSGHMVALMTPATAAWRLCEVNDGTPELELARVNFRGFIDPRTGRQL